jgi:hypothetical protein
MRAGHAKPGRGHLNITGLGCIHGASYRDQNAGIGPVVMVAIAMHLVTAYGETDHASFLFLDVTVVSQFGNDSSRRG